MTPPRPSWIAMLALAALSASCAAGASKRSGGDGGQGGEETGGSSGNTGGKMGGTGGRGGSSGSTGGSSGGGAGGGAATGGSFGGLDAGSSPDGGQASGGAGGSFADAGGFADAGPPGPRPPDAMENPCVVRIIPIAPGNLDTVPAGSRVRVEAAASGPMAPRTPVWTWTVQHVNTGATVTATVVEMNTAKVEFQLSAAGSYDISARSSAVCVGRIQATVVNDPVATFWLRVTPPAGANVQPMERIMVDVPAGQSTNQDVTLGIGFAVAIDPHMESASGTPEAVPSYVRITGEGSTVQLEGHTRGRPFNVRLNSTLIYNVLVIPDGPVAPQLFRGSPTQIGQFKMDAGVPLKGQVTSAKGPVVGARILLRAGPVPSTVGVTGNTGLFELRARANGGFAAAIIPPPRSGLPEARMAPGEGLNLYPPLPPQVGLDFQWDAIPTTTLDLSITDAGGVAVRTSVRVRLQSEASSMGRVGTLTLTLDKPYPLDASGFVQLDAISNTAGLVTFPDVPRGSYTATLTPTDGSAAITSVPVDLTGGMVRLAQTARLTAKVSMSGRLLPPQLSMGARLLALDAGADPSVTPPSAIVDPNGNYVLRVDPGRTYSLVLEAIPERSVPRTFLRTVVAPIKDGVREDMTVPTGVAIFGQVTDNAGLPVGGALVEAYCIGRPPSCIDSLAPDTSLVRPTAEAISDIGGNYRLAVPDPKIAN